MPRQCMICKSLPNPLQKRSFHRFPKDELIRNKWIESLNLSDNKINFKTAHICSDHFDVKSFYEQGELHTRRRLHLDAVPQLINTVSGMCMGFVNSKQENSTDTVMELNGVKEEIEDIKIKVLHEKCDLPSIKSEYELDWTQPSCSYIKSVNSKEATSQQKNDQIKYFPSDYKKETLMELNDNKEEMKDIKFELLQEECDLPSIKNEYELDWTPQPLCSKIKSENSKEATSLQKNNKRKNSCLDNKKGKEVQKRWKSSRDCMRRELALQKTPSGGAAKKRRKYMYFDQLQFLRTTMEDRQTTSSLCSVTAESNEAPITDTEPVEVPPIPPVQPTETPKSMKKRPTNNNFEQDILKLLEKRSTNPMDDLDNDKQFLLSLLPLMKKFDDDNKITIRVELMNTIRRVLNDIKAQKNCQNALQSLEPSQGNSQWQPPNIPWQPTTNNQWQPQPGPSWQSSQTSYLHQVTPIPSPSLSVASSEIIDLGESLI